MSNESDFFFTLSCGGKKHDVAQTAVIQEVDAMETQFLFFQLQK